jgi:serpin B
MHKILLILFLIALAGCDPLADAAARHTREVAARPTITQPAETALPVRVAQSSLMRVAPPSAAQADVATFSAGEQEFAFDLYRQLDARPGNLIFSPHSLYLNLVMGLSGAQAETERQMRGALHASLPPDRLHAAANALDQALAAAGKEGSIQLDVAYSLWAQQDFTFLPAFLDRLSGNYGAGVQLVDYTREASRTQAALAINQWARGQTHGQIGKLIDPRALNDKTRLVLASSIYLNAEWLERFEPDLSPYPFTLRDGSQVSVPFITSLRYDSQGKQMESGRYPVITYKDEVSLVEIPYKGERLSFVALIPLKDYPLASLEETLTAEKLSALLESSHGEFMMYVELPKLSFEVPLELSSTLIALGMKDAFDADKADFSGMTGVRDLAISGVAQNTSLRLNELGTEAASASYTGFIEIANPISIRFDHPFLFLIRDRSTGAILFLGRVEDPRSNP